MVSELSSLGGGKLTAMASKVSYSDQIATLKNLKQNSTVNKYFEAFNQFICQVPMSESLAFTWFIVGLKDDIKEQVKMYNPESVHGAYCLAKLKEATMRFLQTKVQNTTHRQEKFQTPPMPMPKECPPSSVVSKNLTESEIGSGNGDVGQKNSLEGVIGLCAPQMFDKMPQPQPEVYLFKNDDKTSERWVEASMFDSLGLEEAPTLGAQRMFD